MSCLAEIILETKPEYRGLLDDISGETTLSLMILAAWQLARILAVQLVEEMLAKSAQAKTKWGTCPKCGKRIQL